MNIKQGYVVCATMRSGSSLLCNLLTKTKKAGNPREYLREHLGSTSDISDSEYADFVHQEIREKASVNGVSGVKMMWWNMDTLLVKIRHALEVPNDMSEQELLSKILPNTKFVFITRRDKVAQSVSLCRAEKTKVWTSDSSFNRKLKFLPPRITGFHINRNLVAINEWESSWQTFFERNSVPVHTIVYEDLACNYKKCVSDVLSFLEVVDADCSSIEPDLRKQSDIYSRFLVRRYRTGAALSKRTPDKLLRIIKSLRLKFKEYLPSTS